MNHIPYFVFGFGFGYWFFYARMFYKMRKINHLITEAQEAIDVAQVDIEQGIMHLKAITEQAQWNEDQL